MFISAPVAPNINLTQQGEEEMAAAQVRLLPQKQAIEPLYKRIIGSIVMTAQKANSPTITVSPAVISLLLAIVVQLGFTIWWASGTAKDVEHANKEIQDLKSENTTMKVYIDTSREKQVKLEAAIETLEKQQQQTNLLLQMKGAK